MIHELWSALPEPLRNNQFFAGGAIIAMVGLFGRQVAVWSKTLMESLKRQVFLEIAVPNDDMMFEWIKVWLHAQPSSKKLRSVMVSIDQLQQHDDDDDEAPAPSVGASGSSNKARRRPTFVITPGLGTHLIRYRNRFLWLSRERQDAPASGSGSTSMHWSDTYGRSKETFRIRFLSRDRNLIVNFLNEVRDFAVPPSAPTMHIYSYYYGWKCMMKRDRNHHRNVILREGQLEELVEDLQAFQNSKRWYEDTGVPYRRGYLFKGKPGGGKTSTAIELALRTDHDLAVVSLAALDDDRLQNAILTLPRNTVILFEDIDCIFQGRKNVVSSEASSGTKVTFSGLLNVLDGVLSRDGTITIMSTNHPELLDPALIRPGRVDREVEFHSADASQATRMFHHFFPGSNGTGELFGSMVGGRGFSMCSLQEHLSRHRSDPQTALINVDLIKSS